MPRILNGLELLATTSVDGLMSATDKIKLDSINEIQIDKTIDTPAAIMSFTDGADNIPMALTVKIEPVQSGSGDPSPSNVRSISGWTGCNVSVSPTTDPDDPDKEVYSISFGEAGTVYGGTLTINRNGTGTLMVDHGYADLGTLNWSVIATASENVNRFCVNIGGKRSDKTNGVTSICSELIPLDNAGTYSANKDGYTIASDYNIYVYMDAHKTDTKEQFKAAMSGVQLVYELVSPVTYELSNLEAIETLEGLNNVWADTGNINSLAYSKQTSGLINAQDKFKLNSLATVSLTGNYNDLLNKPDLSVYLTTVPTMVGATSSAAGTAGLVPAPTTGDVDKFLAGDGTYKSGGLPMVILSYGNSTWQDFIDAYNNNVIVYCRASSNSNPATGSQTRMAFMAYVNNSTTPTNVEFQYYRSMNPTNKTINQLSDQVFVYKLDKTSGWSVTTREASIKSIVFDSSTGLTGTYNYSTGVLTITAAT